MKAIKIAGVIILVMAFHSCKDFNELQIDPNRVTLTHPGLILTNLEVSTFRTVGTGTIDLGAALASRMLVFTDGATDEQYYSWQRAGFQRYNMLRQAAKMEEEAERLALDNYKSLALFFKSLHILEVTRVFGDVPYTEALQAPAGIYTPKYDLQQDIYIKVLDDLKAASTNLDASKGLITGDIIYGGDISRWKKLINSLSLRVLISLSNKTGNATLGVANRFREIVNNPTTYPVFTSNDDNAALHFVNVEGNRYPYLNNNNLKTAYYMEQSFVNLLKDRFDPRLFIFADQNPLGSGLPDDDFTAYDGLDGSAPLADNTNRVVDGEASRIDIRYYNDPINEPAVILSYAEVEFTLAEAAARTWITADPADHYENGVRASMDFFEIGTAEQDQYLTETDVAYVPADGIELIVTQKYINYFMNGGWEPFFNHLRTGFPAFTVDGGGVLNNQQVPKRWMYPQDETQLNPQNLSDAIQRQFAGAGDNINGLTWLLKTE